MAPKKGSSKKVDAGSDPKAKAKLKKAVDAGKKVPDVEVVSEDDDEEVVVEYVIRFIQDSMVETHGDSVAGIKRTTN